MFSKLAPSVEQALNKKYMGSIGYTNGWYIIFILRMCIKTQSKVKWSYKLLEMDPPHIQKKMKQPLLSSS